jgi:hypothetical protein
VVTKHTQRIGDGDFVRVGRKRAGGDDALRLRLATIRARSSGVAAAAASSNARAGIAGAG